MQWTITAGLLPSSRKTILSEQADPRSPNNKFKIGNGLAHMIHDGS